MFRTFSERRVVRFLWRVKGFQVPVTTTPSLDPQQFIFLFFFYRTLNVKNEVPLDLSVFATLDLCRPVPVTKLHCRYRQRA